MKIKFIPALIAKDGLMIKDFHFGINLKFG